MRYAIHPATTLFLMLAATTAWISPAQAGRVALVTGNGVYTHTRVLPDARSDARPIAGALRKIGLGLEVAGENRLLAVSAKPEPAVPRLSEATVRARLAGVQVMRSADRPGWLKIGTWREPEIRLHEAGFQLDIFWNGIDDREWPATRITEVLAAEVCGHVRSGVMEGLLRRLYRTRSLVPEVALGGNAGSSFEKRLTGSLGACRVEILAEGARWHTLAIAVSR